MLLWTVVLDVTLDCGADVDDLTLTGAVTDAVDSCNPGIIIEANFIETGRETQPDGCDELTIITYHKMCSRSTNLQC